MCFMQKNINHGSHNNIHNKLPLYKYNPYINIWTKLNYVIPITINYILIPSKYIFNEIFYVTCRKSVPNPLNCLWKLLHIMSRSSSELLFHISLHIFYQVCDGSLRWLFLTDKTVCDKDSFNATDHCPFVLL